MWNWILHTMVVSHSVRVTQVRVGGDHSRMTDSTWVSSSEGLTWSFHPHRVSYPLTTHTHWSSTFWIGPFSMSPNRAVFCFWPHKHLINYYCKCWAWRFVLIVHQKTKFWGVVWSCNGLKKYSRYCLKSSIWPLLFLSGRLSCKLGSSPQPTSFNQTTFSHSNWAG